MNLPTPHRLPGAFDTETFLRDYWQRKPLVIRNAFPDLQVPISAEELAGLACEEGISGRLILEKGGAHPWEVRYAPLAEADFADLPDSHWTLLVNDVEKHLPELVVIPDAFRFLPEWRIDDLMISYAVPGGSVGPHLDQYDVFIIQAEGHRRWQISTAAVAADNQIKGTDLRIQREFNPEQEWLLAPGDMIYIPPGVSHNGVATDHCMSLSVGFRAASYAEMLADFIAYISEDSAAKAHFRDGPLQAAAHPNEVRPEVINELRETLRSYLDPNHPALAHWFGRFVSDSKTDLSEAADEHFETATALTAAHPRLCRHPASHFAFMRGNTPQASYLFVDGQEHRVGTRFAEQLCAERCFELAALIDQASAAEQELLLDLYHSGQLIEL